MTIPGAMNNQGGCAQAGNRIRHLSAFLADSLTTELRGWDNSTRNNFFTLGEVTVLSNNT